MSPSTVRDVSRGSFYLGLEQLTMVVGGVLYSIIVLRMLGPATYGILTLGQATIGLAGVLTTNIETYLERFVAELEVRGLGGVLRPLIRKVFAVKGLLALAAGMLVILLADPIATAYGYRDLRRLLPVLAPLVFLECAYLVLRFTLFGLQRFRSIWIVALANNLLKLAVVFTLWRLHEGVVALVGGLVLVQILTVGGFTFLVLRFLPPSAGTGAEVPTYRRIWSYALPLYGARVFFLSGQHLNRLILGVLMPAHSLGLASFALLTIERFIALAASVPNSLLPALSRLRGEGREGMIEQVVNEGHRVVAALAVVVMTGTFCLAREAVLITGGYEFLGAVVPLQILAVVPLFRTIQQPINMCFYTYEKTRIVFWLAGLKFVMEPVCYPLLIPYFGVAGVAMASLFSSMVVFGPAMRIADRFFPTTTGTRRRSVWSAWGIGAAILLIGWVIHGLGEPWPGLPARSVLLIGGMAAVLFSRIVRGEDLRQLGIASRRPWAERVSSRLALWVDRVQGRSTV